MIYARSAPGKPAHKRSANKNRFGLIKPNNSQIITPAYRDWALMVAKAPDQFSFQNRQVASAILATIGQTTLANLIKSFGQGEVLPLELLRGCD